MKGPLISVVIPAHNEERHIKLCLAALERNKGNFEVIVVNDGSNDKTRQMAEKSKTVKKILNFDKSHSAAFARNRGAEISSGKYLVFIDADQIVENGFIEKVENYLRETDADGSDFLVLSYKTDTFIQKAWSAYRKAYPTLGFVHIVRRSKFSELKFDERIFYQEEIDFRERFDRKKFKYDGPIDAKVYHIDPGHFEEFIRQRRWQGRQAGLKYFLPCLLPLLELVPLINVYLRSKDFPNALRWFLLDLIGRYISLYYRIFGK